MNELKPFKFQEELPLDNSVHNSHKKNKFLPKQKNRLDDGQIIKNKELEFTFNGERLFGFEGDTLASALLANNKILVGRSFKYHRPRGIFSSSSEEPNALMELGSGEFKEPNVKATTVKLIEGLESKSQNHLGPLGFDLMAVTDLLHPFLGAGFYYKTFM